MTGRSTEMEVGGRERRESTRQRRVEGWGEGDLPTRLGTKRKMFSSVLGRGAACDTSAT